MFTHIMVGVNDMEASKAFYDAVLSALGHNEGVMDPKGRCFYMADGGVFCLTPPINGEPATHANGGTIGFRAKDQATADAFHAAGLASGGTTCEDPPGLRGEGEGAMYLAYLRDPAGNKICALCR
ncbi:MAG: VOC family protein [Alphaproteobacteria bacterium]|nr:MAG: VOC family protein [Alphaproteobacteria bacterium]